MNKKKIAIIAGVLVLVSGLVSYGVVKYNSRDNKLNNATTVQQPVQQVTSTQPKEEEKKPEFEASPNHPIILVYRYNNATNTVGGVIGGSGGGKWFGIGDFNVNYKGKAMKVEQFKKSYDMAGKSYGKSDMIKGDEIYKLYSNNKFVTTVKGIGQEMFVSPANGEAFLNTKFNTINAKEEFFIGVNGTWNAIPRELRSLSSRDSYSVDIEGDGNDEVIQIETNEIERDGYQGRKEKALEKTVILKKDNKSIVVDKFEMGNDSYNGVQIYTMDLNGDGKLEIVTHVSYGYGSTIAAYDINGGKVQRVMSHYDGD